MTLLAYKWPKKQVQSAVNKNVGNETGEALACQQFQEMLFKTLVLSIVGWKFG